MSLTTVHSGIHNDSRSQQAPLRYWTLVWLCLLLATIGCQTGGSGWVKTRGVYTTLAIPDQVLDLPAGGYEQKNSFGPGEMPGAVIVGFGAYNQPESVALEIVELSTGRSVLAGDYRPNYHKVVMQPLVIRLSGAYKARVLMNGTELDSCEFTVTRTNGSGTAQATNTNSRASYAHGGFSAGIQSQNPRGLFTDYNDKLTHAILNSLAKESKATYPEMFAQRDPGKLIIRCRLDSEGRITEPQILERTVDDECAAIFQKALLNGSPYARWSEEEHRKLGSDFRTLDITIALD